MSLEDLKAKLNTPAPALEEEEKEKEKEMVTNEPAVEAAVVAIVPEKTYHVFYNKMPSCRMVTTTGRVIAFVAGRYITEIEEDILYLQTEIALGSKTLSVKPGKEVMTAAELDPMAELRKEHLREFKALQAEAARKIAAGEPLSQSESEVTPLTPGSTSDIASLAAGSGQ